MFSATYNRHQLDSYLHFREMYPVCSAGKWGVHVEALQPVTAPDRPPVQGRLILITLLAVFPFLALLVMEQSRVIEAQRGLIRQLVGDSMELNNIKAHSINSNAAPVAPAAPASPAPKSQAPAAKPQKPNHSTEAPQPAPRPQPRRVIDMTHLKAA